MFLNLAKDKTIHIDSEKLCSIKSIGLMGPFSGGNLGDAAIQQSMIENMRQFNPEIEIYGFSLNPQDTELRHGILSYPINRDANLVDYCWWKGKTEHSLSSKLTRFLIQWKNNISNRFVQKLGSKVISGLLEILAWLRAYRNFSQLELDSLIVSGGGQLDDYWGGAWGHPSTLFRWGLISKISGTKFMIVSTGAGPINSPLSKLFTRATLSMADYRSYRDEDSKKYIEKVVGFKRSDPVYHDLAFSLPTQSYQNQIADQPHRPIVGIGPMSYFNPRAWPDKDSSIYSEYLTKLASFVTWLIEQKYTVALFPGQSLHDRWAIRDFQELLNNSRVPQERIIEKPIVTVEELMTQLAATDIVIASRFHGVLLSLLMNKPMLALSYHRKIDMLMADTGQSEYCLSIDDFEVDTMKDKFTTINSNYNLIKEQLAIKTQEYKSSLEKQYEYLIRSL